MALPPERELIEALTEGLESKRNERGTWDDCAVVPLGAEDLVATVDTFASPSHFPEGTPPRLAGRLAATASMSDLAAAGADPIGVLVGYGLPSSMELEAARELAAGVREATREQGAEVLGGDTKPRESLQLSVTALGTCPEGTAMSRGAARPGDRVFVTGPLGGAGAALDRIRDGEDPSEATPLLDPPGRVSVGVALREAGVRCAMDLSDGLADGAVAIAQASQVGVRVEQAAIPLHPWAAGTEAGLEHALGTGGDYELLFTVQEDQLDAALGAARATRADPVRVGEVTAGEGATLVTPEGTQALGRGYEHRFDA